MCPELSNIRSQYPFVYGQTSDSAQLSVIQAIRCIQLWVYSQEQLRAFVTAYSSASLTIHIEELDSSNSFNIQVDSTGIFAPHQKLDSKNSFVEFSNPIVDSGTCNLQMLPQVLQQIPKGLQFTLYSHKVSSVANYSDSETQQIEVARQLNLLSGYNCQPSIVQNSLLLTAAAGLGQGSPSAHYMRHLTQPGVDYPDAYFAGVKAVNGISDKLHIGVSGSMWLTTTSNNGITVLGINKTDESANDTP